MEPFDTYMTVDERDEFAKAFDDLQKPKEDLVKTPGHYTHYLIEPLNYILRNRMEFWRGSVIKYASRAGHKTYDGMTSVESEITDLKKAIRYCEARINHLRGEQTL